MKRVPGASFAHATPRRGAAPARELPEAEVVVLRHQRVHAPPLVWTRRPHLHQAITDVRRTAVVSRGCDRLPVVLNWRDCGYDRRAVGGAEGQRVA